MNKFWAELNKEMQLQLKKEATFADGIATLFELRGVLCDSLFERGRLPFKDGRIFALAHFQD